MTDVTVIIGDKSTIQVLDQDSGAGEANPDRIFVPLTGDFAPGDLVWVTDDNSDGELGTVQAIVADDYLDMVDNLAGLYSVAQNATAILIKNISNDIIDADTWRDRLTYIGRCKLHLNNRADKYGGAFAANDLIVVSINGTILWRGYVDIAKPYLPVKGVKTNLMIITGRDDGRRQTDLSFTKKYPTQWAADIVADIMSILGDPYLYTDDGQYGGEVQIKFEAIRTKLGDALREICELSGRDYLIDTNGRLHLFEAASVDSGVVLHMVAGDPTNELLTFDEIEVDGYTIKNHFEAHGGSVKDHYTNQGAYLFTDAGGATTTDEINDAYFGGSALKITCVGVSRAYLDFAGAGVCSYSPSIDLRKSCESKVRIKGAPTVPDAFDFFNLQPYALDTTGRKILFTRNGPNILSGKGSPKGWTEGIQDLNDFNHWLTLSYPLGASTSNKVKVNPTTGSWHAVGWNPLVAAFDWEHVEHLGFEWPQGDNGYVLLDAWSIPSLEAHAIAENAASQLANDLRMDSELRKELKSQLELEEYAAAVVLDKKDAIQKFKAVARGQVGTKYAAEWVLVNVPDYGINNVEYIITLLHHKVHQNKLTRGFDFITEYDLVAEIVTGYRVILEDNPMATMMDKLRRENRGFKGGIEADDLLLGDVISGGFTNTTRGATFPTDAATGDIHFLTADLVGPPVYYGNEGVNYEYDETTTLWTREPIVMHRAVQPPATGGLIGDTWHDTANDLWYECTAEDPDIWSLIDFAATSISGTLDADQLKKGIQKFDSSVLVEAIQVLATAAVTLAIDVNDGTGKAEITASAGVPFADFTAGDKLVIQHCEDRTQDTTARTVNAVNGGGSSITLDNILAGVDNADDETMQVLVSDAVKWTGATPAVWFADGTNQNIANGSVQGLAAGNHWVIFTVGGAVSLTNVYANAVGNTVGIIGRVRINFSYGAFVFPVFTRGGSTTLDFLGAGIIDTFMLTGDALIGKIMKSSDGVDWADGVGDPGTIMTRLGIKGKGIAGVTQFALSSVDGKGYFGAGAVILDANGMTVDGNNLITFKDGVGGIVGVIGGQVALIGIVGANNTTVFFSAQGTGNMQLESVGTGQTLLTSAVANLLTAPESRIDGILLSANDETDDLGDPTHRWDVAFIRQRLLDISPDDDHTVHGITIPGTAGENLVFGDFVYLKNDGKWWKSDADAEATMPIGAMAIETIATNNTGTFLTYGIARDDTWGWTVGALQYASTTPARLQEVQPAGSGDQVQVVSEALTATVILFRPVAVLVEIA